MLGNMVAKEIGCYGGRLLWRTVAKELTY